MYISICTWYRRVYTSIYNVQTIHIQLCTLYIHVYVTDIIYYVEPRWTQEELEKVIAMLQDPQFDSKDIDPDLQKRMDKAVQDGCIKCFNMRESVDDGDQDLHLWAREAEDVLREIMEDPLFKGHQNFKFEMDLDEVVKRLFGGEANAGVAFQIGQLRCVIYSYKDVHVYVQYRPCPYTYVHGTYLYIHTMYPLIYSTTHEHSCMYMIYTCTYI